MTKSMNYEIIILVAPNASTQDLKCLAMDQLSTRSTERWGNWRERVVQSVIGNQNVDLFVLQQLPKIPADVGR